MSLTILYHDPERPRESPMTLIAASEMAMEVIEELEEQGFVVDRVTVGSATKVDPLD